jgi:hypothetical protein
MKKAEEHHLRSLFTGDFARLFLDAIVMSMIVPVVVLLFPKGRKPFPAFLMGILVVVGSWFKRYLIVTPTMLSPFLPMYNVPSPTNIIFHRGKSGLLPLVRLRNIAHHYDFYTLVSHYSNS